jgi:hypothetical protein
MEAAVAHSTKPAAAAARIPSTPAETTTSTAPDAAAELAARAAELEAREAAIAAREAEIQAAAHHAAQEAAQQQAEEAAAHQAEAAARAQRQADARLADEKALAAKQHAEQLEAERIAKESAAERAERQAKAQLVEPIGARKFDPTPVTCRVLPKGDGRVSRGEHIPAVGEDHYERGERFSLAKSIALELEERGFVEIEDPAQA